MTSGDPATTEGAAAILELLAAEAPPQTFHDIVAEARARGTEPAALAELERAKDLALRVSGHFARARQREAGLQALVETARDLTPPYDLDALLRIICRRARLLLNVDMSAICLTGEDGGAFSIRVTDGQVTALPAGEPVPRDSGLGSEAVARAAPTWTSDYLADVRIPHTPSLDNVARAEGLRAVLAVPLRDHTAAFGVLYAADRTVRHFTPDEIALMSSLADLAAVAIEKTRQLRRVQSEIAELEVDTSRLRSRLATALHVGEARTRMVDLILDGGDLQRLAELAAEALDGALLIRGADNSVLASARNLPEFDDVCLPRAALEAHATGRPVRLADQAWICALTAGSEDLGTMLFRPSGALREEEHPLLEHTARTASLLALMQGSTTAAETEVRDAFFDDLLTSPDQLTGQMRERARRLDLDPARPHVLVVAQPEGGSHGRAVVWASSYALRKGGLKSVNQGSITLMLPAEDAAATAREVSEVLSPLLDHPVTVTASGPFTGLGSVRPALQEALRCLHTLTSLGRRGATATVRELGFLGTLMGDGHDVARFIADTIGPVIDYDTQRLTALVGTLEEYFASGGSPTRSADSLHVHPNTVSRRLERISDLLGPDWREPERALEIQLALQLHRTREALVPDPGERPGGPYA